MSPAQQKKYWWEWARCSEHLTAQGFSAERIKAERHNLHRKALGQDKSSTKFTNGDFDSVIAVFRAVWDGGNFAAQMRLQEQPEERARMTRARIEALMPAVGVEFGRERAYLNGMCRRIFGCDQFQKLTDAQAFRLEGIMIKRVHQMFDEPTAKAVIEKARAAQPIQVTQPKAGTVPGIDPSEDDGEAF